jgi:hypothetical protein
LHFFFKILREKKICPKMLPEKGCDHKMVSWVLKG